ncbi:hypothetical protein [Stenomitos frigidus]|uniref:Uncharacterized protein n=1 Tax=Stenomitos frigidus ULC18 TaxID=2107698 RepID=A0A2T1EB56_9CYAN|nr:hypothetical protein [Stenomitos frigidus]PSB29925.1 hypothetical protein C7B82_10250 [Stenomitos frigidus ULC18]
MAEWTQAMLDTLAGVVSVQAGEITTLKGISDNNTATILMLVEEQRLDRHELRNAIEEQRLDRREFIARMDAMQSEIRGLQTENRRILERLEGLSQP